MCLVGTLLAAHLVATQLFFRLRSAKQIGGKFGAAHVVEYFLTFLQPFRGVNVLGPAPAIQTFVTVILKDGAVRRRFHSGILGRSGKVFVVLGEFIADRHALLVFR